MHIAQVSKADSYGGGASRVAEHLHESLVERGYFSHHLASWSGKGYVENTFPLYGRYENKIRKLHSVTKKLFVPEAIPYEIFPLERHRGRSYYNLMHFHDLSSAISPITLQYLSRKIPVLWTIHDCSAVTAGCLYPMGCEKYKRTCHTCPQKGIWPMDSKVDFSFIGHYIKKRLHRAGTVSLVTPSQWMADFVRSSGQIDQEIKVISNGIDTKIYRPEATSPVRQMLSSKPGLKVLLSSGDILDERKGIRYAMRVLDKLKHLSPLIIVAGNVSEEAKKLFVDFDTYYAGYVSERETMASLYASADVFLFCSIADNQPLAVMEALAAGTPVYGFKTGGVPEMVVNGKNGYLVEQGNVNGLAKQLSLDVENLRLEGMGAVARTDAVKKYDINMMAENYIEYYEEVVGRFLSYV